ncbi:hypothetical protein WJX84_000918 [Apatococcus fuscideae]|uniref:Uncharacterized protein n=1 Tax=Apatococcus fuscideae TaxID=2026836 RepID=A0AAW1SYK2_9CHLO
MRLTASDVRQPILQVLDTSRSYPGYNQDGVCRTSYLRYAAAGYMEPGTLQGQENVPTIQAALRRRARLLHGIRKGVPPQAHSADFLYPAAPGTAIAWSLPNWQGSRYVAVQGMKRKAPQQHQTPPDRSPHGHL